jgi:hypothetical protein
MGLFFIPQVIYVHGEPWWNISRRKHLNHPTELDNSTRRHLVAMQDEKGNEMMNFAYEISFSYK